MNNRQPREFWPPLAAGLRLGLVLLAMFLMTGFGLTLAQFAAEKAF